MIRTTQLSWFCRLAAIWLAAIAPAKAQTNPCDLSARTAARETDVPLDLLLALTRVETGRSGAQGVEPWPWTLNMGGPGSWHESAAAAHDAAARAIAAGRRNIDLGCFQINYHWHGAGFADLRQMLDPDANARYAARFLRDLHRELGDWTRAVGAFHSRRPDHAARYLDRFRAIHAALPDAPPQGRKDPAPLPVTARPALGNSPGEGGRPPHLVAARPLWSGALP